MEYIMSLKSVSYESILQMIIWILGPVICFVVLKWWNKYRKTVEELKKLPGFPTNVFSGNLSRSFQLVNRKLDLPTGVYILEKMASMCTLQAKESIFTFWFGHIPVICVFKADMMELILTKNVPFKKAYEYKFLQSYLGFGLITSDGEKWRSRRKILTPAFHFKHLSNFISVFNEQSMILVKKFQLYESEECPDIFPHCVSCALDAIVESAMGISIKAQENSKSKYRKAYNDMTNGFNHRLAHLWMWPDFIFFSLPEGRKFQRAVKFLSKVNGEIIEQRKKLFLENCHELEDTADQDKDDVERKTYKKKPFLDLLLDIHVNQQLLTEEDVKEEVNTFIAAGNDSTGVTITWTLYCIGLYSNIQEKIIEEIDSIFKGNKERPASLEDIKNMKHLERTIKETQRLYTPAPLIGRQFREDIEVNGVTVPKGTTFYFFLNVLHRDPDQFPNPEIFDPDRFLPEVAINRHSYAYIPFSSGPRNCLGQKYAMMEEKVVIANILRHFKIVSLDSRDKIPATFEITQLPAKPVKMKFIPRTTFVPS